MSNRPHSTTEDAQDVTGHAPTVSIATWEGNFIANMQASRERQGMTQLELAKALRARGFPFHQQTVQRIEKGERPVRLNEAMEISAILKAPMAELLMPRDPNADIGRAINYLINQSLELSEEMENGIQAWVHRGVLRLYDFGHEQIDYSLPLGDQSPLAKLVIVFYAKAIETFTLMTAGFKRISKLANARRELEDDEDFPNEVFDVIYATIVHFRGPELTELAPMTMAEILAKIGLPEKWPYS